MNRPTRPRPVLVTLLCGAVIAAALIAWHELPPALYLAVAAIFGLLLALDRASRGRDV